MKVMKVLARVLIAVLVFGVSVSLALGQQDRPRRSDPEEQRQQILKLKERIDQLLKELEAPLDSSLPLRRLVTEEEAIIQYDSATQLFRWKIAGGLPALPGGVMTRQDLEQVLESDSFRQIMLEAGFRDSHIQEARARKAEWREGEPILPNTSKALFAKVSFGAKQPGTLQSRGPVMWSGNHPIDTWVLTLNNGTRMGIGKNCGNGLNFIGRVERVEVPVEVEKVVEKRIEVPVERIVEKRVEVPVEKIVYRDREVPVREPCAGCPKIDVDFSASWMQRTPLGAFTSWGNFFELVSSVGTGGLASYLVSHKSQRRMAGLRSGGYSAGAYMVANALNPEDNRAKVFVEGREVFRGLKRGQEGSFSGGRVIWDEDRVQVLISDGRGGEMLCGFAEPGRKVNFTPVVLADRMERVPVQLPPPPVVKPPGFPPPRPGLSFARGTAVGVGAGVSTPAGAASAAAALEERKTRAVSEALRRLRP